MKFREYVFSAVDRQPSPHTSPAGGYEYDGTVPSLGSNAVHRVERSGAPRFPTLGTVSGGISYGSYRLALGQTRVLR